MYIIQTDRLFIRKATSADAAFLANLWNDGRVMRYVSFPKGLGTSEDKVRAQINAAPEGAMDQVLMVETREGVVIGQCKLGSADEEGVAHTDVKLHPDFWQKGYGTEIKQALVNWLFVHTTCTAIRATPNKLNLGSIGMQEAVGGRRVGEGVFSSPQVDDGSRCDVPYYEYRVFREDWEKKRANP